MLYPNVETFIGCDSSYRAASIVLYGAPYDSTTSYRPGARFGPAAIRHESYGLETYSPYQNADLTDFDIFDSGDLELCFGSSESALADIQSRAAEILHDGKFPLLLGGEHLVTLGAVRAMVEKYPDLHIVHFDAHADLRDDYLGATLSHACVLRRCHDLIGDGRIHQFCIRSGDRTEFEFAAAHTEMHKFDFTGLAQLTEQLCASKVPVYLTIDLDCLDPSCFPGTGTPEAGGVSFLQLLEAIRTVTKANIVGADLNELAPTLDTTGVSTATACKVLRELLNEESYICVGRAADFVLKDKPNVLTVYIDAPYEDRIEREMKRQGIGRSQAIHYIDKLDHYRESYYKYHTGRQWKRVENYDLCLDSAAVGLDNCVEVIKKVIELKFGVKCPR
mgnify:CR=1 FL=1